MSCESAVFDRLLTKARLAQVIGKGPKTIDRMIDAGLPSIKVGRERLFVAETVNAWLISQEKSRNTIAPTRGRPRKNAA